MQMNGGVRKIDSGFAPAGITQTSGTRNRSGPICRRCSMTATIFHCLGIDPHQELQTPTGRPVQLFREGKVVEKLLA